MHAKLILFLTVLTLGSFFYLYTQNPGLVTIVLTKDYSYTLPMALILFLSFLGGVVVLGLDVVITDAGKAIREAKARKAAARVKEARSNYLRGVDALSKGDTEGARGLIKKALASMPGETDMVLGLAESFSMEGKPGAALDVLETESFRNPHSVVILMAIGKYAMEAGELSRAARAFEDALKVNSKNPCAIARLRDINMKKGRWREAVTLEKRLLGPDRGGWLWGGDFKSGMLPGLLYEAAMEYVDEDKLEDAEAALKDALKRDDFFIPAYILLAGIQTRRAGNAEGIKVLEKAYTRHPGSVPLILALEDSNIKESAPQKMIEMYKKEIEARPDDDNMRILLARFYLRLEMADRAAEALERLHSEGKETFYTTVLLGEAYLKKNNAGDAALMFKDALGMGVGLMPPPFSCRLCGRPHRGWATRCPGCGEWNTLGMNPDSRQA